MFVASAMCFVWDTKPDLPSVYSPIVLLYIVQIIEKHKILATNKENNQAHQPKKQRKGASVVE